MNQHICALVTGLAVLLAVPAVAVAAEITVLSDGPLAPALRPIADAFTNARGHQVKFVFGLSPAIHKKVTDGEAGDVLIIQPDFINDLVAANRIVAGQHPTVAKVGIGLFTRAGAQAPDISTVTSFKQALLDADALVFSNVASGNYFATVLDRLGISGAVKDKAVRTSPPDVVTRVLQGKGADFGVSLVTLIKSDTRLQFIGTLPAEYQSYLVYAAAALTNARSPEAAADFIKFLSSPEARKAFVASGAE